MKILIAEDNADDRKMLKYNLEHRGCEVIEAADGQEGLSMARAHKPGLIISDALMLHMDGFQFLRSVKTDEALKAIPFVFYSAVYTGNKEAELALSLGAEAFIVKPKDPQEFWEELTGILEECRLRNHNKVPAVLLEEEEAFLRKYSDIVAAKLEEKVRELEQARAALDAKDREWQVTFDSIGDCVTIHDKDFNLLLANKACEKLFGVSNDEIRSRKCFDLFHGRKEPHETCPKIMTEQTGISFGIEIFEPRFNCWLAITCFPLFDKNGAVQRVVHFAKDITQRKKMEEELKKSEARFRATFEQAAMGIAHVSTDGHWLRVNKKLCDIIGYSGEELLAMTFQDITHPDDLETDLHYLRQVLDGEIKTYSMEKRCFRKDKSLVWVKLTVSLVRDDLGQPHYFISVLEDITEQAKLKAQLLQAQKMEAVGQLAGGVAHDFNNILTAIIGYGNLALMKMAEDDPQRLNIKNMLEGANKAAHLTKELLLFSRKQISERKPVDLNKVITNVEKFLKRVIGEDINYKTILSEQPIQVLADSHQLEQVLMNLVTNARDAMPEGGNVTVMTEKIKLNKDFTSAHGYGKAGTYVMVTVADSGHGMDEEMRQRIFEPFFTTKEVGKGTGLGLAVVYGIIKQHDGFINVYSEPGKGTTFKIYLPVIASMVREEETVVRKEEAPARGTETVLVAEDDEILRKLSRTVLTEFGYTVIEAVDGEDAVNKFMENKDKIQILLFDLIMPKMNGKDAFDEIRKITPDMKVIFASGYAPDIARQKMLLEDSAHILFKPMSPHELLRTLRSVLDEK